MRALENRSAAQADEANPGGSAICWKLSDGRTVEATGLASTTVTTVTALAVIMIMAIVMILWSVISITCLLDADVAEIV